MESGYWVTLEGQGNTKTLRMVSLSSSCFQISLNAEIIGEIEPVEVRFSAMSLGVMQNMRAFYTMNKHTIETLLSFLQG